MAPMAEEPKPVSGRRVLLFLLLLALIMQTLLILFIVDVRTRKPAILAPATQPATPPETSPTPPD